MNPARERRVIELLEQAMQLPANKFPAFLERSCGSDRELRERVEALWSAWQDSSEFLADSPTQQLRPDGDDARAVTDRTDALPPGLVLADRYTIVEPIGSGGMGSVYRATDDRLDREVALKVLNLAGMADQEMRNRFDREVKSVAALSHPNIVTLFDVTQHHEVQFAVMELVRGQTIRQLISEGIGVQPAISIARRIASGLAAAHQLDIMHRDMKPENVMVSENGTPKILDFGLARRQEVLPDQELTAGGITPGTIPYMSPEQAGGEELTCATDVFSLGIVLFEMVAGTNPFRASTGLQTMQRISEANPPALHESADGVPERLAEIVRSMLSRRPTDRPAAETVADQLAMIADTAEHASAKGISETTQVSTNRSPKWQPSLVVRPFDCLGGDASLEPVSDALAENLTTILTRVPMLSLMSRGSSQSLRDSSLTASAIREQLGVDYMVEGSLQPTSEGVQANVQLIETKEGFQVWAQTFECPLGDQTVSDLLHRVLLRLEPQIIRAIFNDLRDESGEMSGRQLLIQAISVLALKGWHRDSFSEAARLLRQSVELEPDFALSRAHLALVRGLAKRVGLAEDPEAAAKEAIAHADAAVDLDSWDSNVLGTSGCALADVGEIDRAVPLLKNAIDINPNNAQAHAALGAAYLNAERFEAGAEQLAIGIKLSPADSRLAVWYALLANAQLQLGQHEAALLSAQTGCQSDRKNYLPRIVLAAVHCVHGDSDAALNALKETFRVQPELTKEEMTMIIGRPLALALTRLHRSSQRAPQAKADDAAANPSAGDGEEPGNDQLVRRPASGPSVAVSSASNVGQPVEQTSNANAGGGPPSIAVLPLQVLSLDPNHRLFGDAIAQEVIVDLAKLRWLFVIARGSSFQFRDPNVDLSAAGRTLGAKYLVTGTIEVLGGRSVLVVELLSAKEGRIVWTDRFETSIDELLEVRRSICERIVAAIETRIQSSEAELASRITTENLDAWSAYHRGLWHMYQFNQKDNQIAQNLFERAIKVDKRFARAHAGLSFTHFQDAFLGFSENRQSSRDLVRRSAETSLELDRFDPFVNLTMGRAAWINDQLDEAASWLDHSVDLCPNYAFAFYNRGLIDVIRNEGGTVEKKIRKAISLSPIDPLNYAFYATVAMSNILRRDHEAAVEWADQAVRQPNAHAHIYVIAGMANALAGRTDAAQKLVDRIRNEIPSYTQQDFFQCFQFSDPDAIEQFKSGLHQLGI